MDIQKLTERIWIKEMIRKIINIDDEQCKVTIIGCPKLDDIDYTEKLTRSDLLRVLFCPFFPVQCD